MFGVIATRWMARIGNMVDRIGNPRIFRDGLIVVIWLICARFEDDIFQDSPSLNRPIDIWFLYFGQTDTLGITAALYFISIPFRVAIR